MTPVFSGIGAASVRGFGRIFKGPGQFIWDTEVLLSTTGAGNWTKPEGVTQVQIECWGAGGGGGDSVVNGAGGGGGGGGGYARSIITYPSASQSIPYVVGASGSGTTWNSNQVLARGGTQGGTGFSSSETAVAGKGGGIDFPNIGDVTYIGGNGNLGWSLNVASSGIEFSSGGGAAGSTGDGGNANINVGPGTGTADFGGAGAIGTQGDVNFTGLNGNIYGGGGSGGQKVSGGQTRLGGLGAQGLIRIRYLLNPATGGTVTSDATHIYHTFTGSGTFTVNSNITGADILVVAGGGGGGGNRGGGGGAGGVRTVLNTSLSPGSYSIVVGAGGDGSGAAGSNTGFNGNNSSALGTISTGGGGGGTHSAASNGANGGSGGGAAMGYNENPTFIGGTGTSGQGNNGANSSTGKNNGFDVRNTGGGGGAGAAGTTGSGVLGGTLPNGGAGISVFGTNYGGGGGGARGDDDIYILNPPNGLSAGGGTGGIGGGGNGNTLYDEQNNSTAGQINSGGGGGGGGLFSNGANGGSGIVVIRYLKP